MSWQPHEDMPDLAEDEHFPPPRGRGPRVAPALWGAFCGAMVGIGLGIALANDACGQEPDKEGRAFVAAAFTACSLDGIIRKNIETRRARGEVVPDVDEAIGWCAYGYLKGWLARDNERDPR